MYLPDLVVRSRRVVTGNSVTPAAIHVRAGRIIGVLDADNVPEGCPVDDAGDLVVMPGAVEPCCGFVSIATARAHAPPEIPSRIPRAPPA